MELPLSEEEIKNLFQNFAVQIAKLFKQSKYPHSPFNLDIEGFIELHIRIPPFIPELLKQYNDKIEYITKVICIENIKVAKAFRGMGFFKKILKELSKLDIDYIVIGHIENEKLAQYFDSNKWHEFQESFLPLSLLKDLPSKAAFMHPYPTYYQNVKDIKGRFE